MCQGRRGCAHRCNELCHAGLFTLSSLSLPIIFVSTVFPSELRLALLVVSSLFSPRASSSGPHPVCAQTITKKCFCGRSSQRVRCSKTEDAGLSCNKPCRKLLNCGVHRCVQRCHAGPCSPCEEQVLLKCFSHNTPKAVPCGSALHRQAIPCKLRYNCINPCERLLDCSHHRCQEKCHEGPCQSCLLTPDRVTTCPCGRIPLRMLAPATRQSCLDPIPTCLGKCQKTLRCQHSCSVQCHHGQCPPCQAAVSVSCRCNGTTRTMGCGEASLQEWQLVCERRCNHILTCGRHRCQKVRPPPSSLLLLLRLSCRL